MYLVIYVPVSMKDFFIFLWIYLLFRRPLKTNLNQRIKDWPAFSGPGVCFPLQLHNVESCGSCVCPYRCTCTSCSAVWLISIPRVFVTEISSLRTSWWTPRRPSSNSVTLAGPSRPWRLLSCLLPCFDWLLVVGSALSRQPVVF